MKRNLICSMVCVAAACTQSHDRGPSAAIGSLGPAFENRYIVVLDNASDPAGVARAVGASPRWVYRHALRGFAAPLSNAAAHALLRNPHVRFIEPDRPVTKSAQTLPTGIDRMDADQNVTSAIDGVDSELDVDVAVLDTGIDLDHPDLNVVGGVHFASGRDRGGEDGDGHGSHVAGTIGARDNGIGAVGIAPGARLWAVKVLNDQGSGSWGSIIAGIDWVTANASVIEVANMSLGGGGSDDTDGGDCLTTTSSLHLAICNSVHAGVVYAVAAGNEADDAENHVPAAYDEVITVSALADFDGQPGGLGTGSYAFSSCTENVDDSLACFSNYGHDVDLIAPGVGIYSTTKKGGYATYSGTSMASPHVAGAVALHVMNNGAPTDLAGALAVRDALIASAIASPCPGGACADDPDGVQEPLAYVGVPCASDTDCDDGSECTSDACVEALCTNAPVTDGASCGLDGICCAGECSAPACNNDADCVDADACTTATCNLPGTCGASCTFAWPACGASDACCGPLCSSSTDIDCPSCLAKNATCNSNAECCSASCNLNSHRCR